MAAQPALVALKASDEAPDPPLPEPLFRTKRLLARPMHPQDAPSAQIACAPASITRYMSLSFAHPYTLEISQKWIASNLDNPYNHLYLTTHEDPRTVIGGIGMKPGSDVQSHTGEVGYWLAEPHWAKGLISEALEGFIEWTFLYREGDGSAPVEGKAPEVKKTRLLAGCFAGNTASMRILEKSRFEKEGVQKGHIVKHGVVSDLHLYALLKADWEARRKESALLS